MNKQKYIEINIVDYMCKTTQLNDVPNREQVWGISKNAVKPTITNTTHKEAINNIVNNYDLVAENTVLVKDTHTNCVINKHKTEVYVKK